MLHAHMAARGLEKRQQLLACGVSRSAPYRDASSLAATGEGAVVLAAGTAPVMSSLEARRLSMG